VADRYGVRERTVFGADLRSAHYDEAASRWHLTAADGRQWTCDALVLGTGALHQPHHPDIEGIGDFAGPVLHTAQWPDDADLDGRRVAVVGTGASAVQLIPEVAPRAARTSVFQRTPAWTMPKHDSTWSPLRRRAFARLPVLQRLVRWGTYWQLEARAPLFVRLPGGARLVERLALRRLAMAVPDREVRAKLTPHYRLGCKRILLSDDYWPTFARPDVDLVTEPISRVEADAVVTADGVRHEVDVLVLGTGFDVGGTFRRLDLRGLGGRTLDEAWSGGMHTHLGITVAGFPELYLLLGPNTGLGHNSVVTMIEFATRYVLDALDRSRTGPRVVDEQVQARFTREMRQRSRGTVWETGCRSWYLDQLGHNTTLWPASTVTYWWRTRRVREADFVPVHIPTRAEEPVDA